MGSIMKRAGGVQHIKTDGGTAYITLSAAGSSLKTALRTKAPAINVQVRDAVDSAVHKALSGDFLIASFGYKPVAITISGLDLYDSCTSGSSIQSFYNNHNVHANKRGRVNVGIAGDGSSGTAYRCVLLALTRSADSRDAINKGVGVGSYTIEMLGVKI